MLFIKDIYLLLFTFTNLPITVRAVWHTAVSCFYTTRCVASCFQPFLRDTFQLLPFNWQVCHSWSVIDYSTTMAFADFSRQALLRFFRKSNYLMRLWYLLGYEQYLSTLYQLYFLLSSRELRQPFRIAIGLWFVMQSYPRSYPCMKFLFVRSDVCRQLPSDFISRWTPLLLAM